MVSLADVQRTNQARAAAATAARPFVAVMAGGTAGIGMSGVLALARTHGALTDGAGGTGGAGLRVYIVGRRASDDLLAACRQLCPAGTFVFVQAQDLGLLADVDRVAAAIAAQEGPEGHIDLLVASQGVLPLGPRRETAGGLDETAALVYYGRARLVEQLLPLLARANHGDSGRGGCVVLVLNPTLEGRVWADDWALRDPAHGGLRTQAGHGAGMMTFWCEALAARHPDTAFVHWYPGAVPTDLLVGKHMPLWLRLLARLTVVPLFRLFGTAPDACGDRLVYFGSSGRYGGVHGDGDGDGDGDVAEGADGVPGSGAYRVAADNDTLPHNTALDADRAAGMADKVYEHTMGVFREARE